MSGDLIDLPPSADVLKAIPGCHVYDLREDFGCWSFEWDDGKNVQIAKGVAEVWLANYTKMSKHPWPSCSADVVALVTGATMTHLGWRYSGPVLWQGSAPWGLA
jgi:hypothetical protein